MQIEAFQSLNILFRKSFSGASAGEIAVKKTEEEGDSPTNLETLAKGLDQAIRRPMDE